VEDLGAIAFLFLLTQNEDPEMDNTNQGKGEHDGVRPEQVESKKLSVEEIAIQLETRKLNPNMVNRKIRKSCIRYYMMRRDYSCRTMAEILHLGERAVQRFTRRVTEEHTMSVDLYWQKNVIGEFLNKCRTQSERLKRLLYSDGLSIADVIKITREQHQLEMNCLKVLERMGYLCKERGIGDVNIGAKADDDREQSFRDCDALLERDWKMLDQEWGKYKVFQGPPEEKAKMYESLKKTEGRLRRIMENLEKNKIEFGHQEDKRKYKYADIKDI
jgi:hypothetical protein